jgi:HEAT repeat protein
VTATASTPPQRLDDLDSNLQALVRHFDRDAVENRKLIRQLLESDRDTFYASALQILKSQNDSRGCQYLVTLFVAFDLLLRALCDASLSKEQALALARSAARVDSLTDVALAKSLAESSGTDEGPIPVHSAGRLMEVLGEISDGTRILPSLMRMLRHPNPYLRSKAVKMIGRGSRSVRWVQNRLNESDPRIRANAIESLWGLDTGEARALLLGATRDGNNRVAGNALVALYRLGDNTIIPDLLKMAEHESALFRSTAAWVMGETGDPRFTEVLAKLLPDSNTAVRSRALAALGRIKASLAQSRAGEEWLLSGALLDFSPQKPARRLQLAVAGEEAHDFPRILPTQVLISDNGQPVSAYKMLERVVGESMTVVFALPREAVPGGSSWTLGVQACNAWRRPSDLWAVSYYLTGPASDAGSDSLEEPPRFSSNSAALEAALEQPPARAECTDLWRTIWRAVRNDKGQTRGKRHLILFSHDEPLRCAGDGLISAVIASRTTVQVIAAEPSPKVEDFCRRARAGFHVPGSDEAIARAIEMACLNLLARYEVLWQSAGGEDGPIRVRIHTPAGWGETTVPLPPAP